jgi:hypothetical protein
MVLFAMTPATMYIMMQNNTIVTIVVMINPRCDLIETLIHMSSTLHTVWINVVINRPEMNFLGLMFSIEIFIELIEKAAEE